MKRFAIFFGFFSLLFAFPAFGAPTLPINQGGTGTTTFVSDALIFKGAQSLMSSSSLTFGNTGLKTPAVAISPRLSNETQNGNYLNLGASAVYNWIQTFGGLPLRINNLGNTVYLGPIGNNAVAPANVPVALGRVTAPSIIGIMGANTAGAFQGFQFYHGGFNLPAGAIGTLTKTGGGGGSIVLSTGSTSTGERMRIDVNTGNVGIGTIAPVGKLDVVGTASSSNLFVAGTATTSKIVANSGSVSSLIISDATSTSLFSSTLSAVSGFFSGLVSASRSITYPGPSGGSFDSTYGEGSCNYGSHYYQVYALYLVNGVYYRSVSYVSIAGQPDLEPSRLNLSWSAPSGATPDAYWVISSDDYGAIYNGELVVSGTSAYDYCGNFGPIGSGYATTRSVSTKINDDVSGVLHSLYATGRAYFGERVGIGTTTPAVTLDVFGPARMWVTSTTSLPACNNANRGILVYVYDEDNWWGCRSFGGWNRFY